MSPHIFNRAQQGWPPAWRAALQRMQRFAAALPSDRDGSHQAFALRQARAQQQVQVQGGPAPGPDGAGGATAGQGQPQQADEPASSRPASEPLEALRGGQQQLEQQQGCGQEQQQQQEQVESQAG
jgi:hypothetical protein